MSSARDDIQWGNGGLKGSRAAQHLYFLVLCLSLLRVVTLEWSKAAEPAQPALALASAIAPERALSSTGNAESFSLGVSEDGRYVLFASMASDLVSTPVPPHALQLFLRDLEEEKTTLVTMNAAGTAAGKGSAMSASLSPDGRFVVFESEAEDLVENDSNGVSDIFLFDRLTGTTQLVSVNHEGTGSANGASINPVMTPDGRHVVFLSHASDLVEEPETDRPHLYFRDLLEGTTRNITSGARPGQAGLFSGQARITPDGAFVVFASTAEGLTPVAHRRRGEVYLWESATGELTHLRAGPQWHITSSDSGSSKPLISDDGKHVSYVNGRPPVAGLFHLNRETQTTTFVATNLISYVNLTEPGGSEIVMSPDGLQLAFSSLGVGSSLIPNLLVATNSALRIWQAGKPGLTTVELPEDENPLTLYVRPVGFYQNGALLAWRSDPNLGDGESRVWLRETDTGESVQVLELPLGKQAETSILLPHFNGSADQLVFASGAPDLVEADYNETGDVFSLDLRTGRIVGVSVAASEAARRSTANHHTHLVPETLGKDGSLLLLSQASDLAPGSGLPQRLLLRQTFEGTTLDLSALAPGLVLPQTIFSFARRSGNGRVVFTSERILPEFKRTVDDLFVYDPASNEVWLASVSLDGQSGGNRSALHPQMSRDGRMIVFESMADNLMEGTSSQIPRIYLRDLEAGATRIAAVVDFESNPVRFQKPLLSPDGRYLLFEYRDTNPGLNGYYCRDLQNESTARLPEVTEVHRFSPDSQWVLVRKLAGNQQLTIAWHPATGEEEFIGPQASEITISSDGRFVSYLTAAPVPGGLQQIEVRDRLLGVTETIFPSPLHPEAHLARPRSPAISGDGRFVIFSARRSDAPLPRFPNLFLFDRLAKVRLPLTELLGLPGTLDGPLARPQINEDATLIAFESLASGLVPGDFNQARDVFLLRLPARDSDGDGMDDEWEIAHFGNLSPDGTGDDDGDGMSDLDEFLAGTNPTRDDSVLRVHRLEFPDAGLLSLSWQTVPGRIYRLEYKENLDEPQWRPLLSPVIATSQLHSVLLHLSEEKSRLLFRAVLLW